MPQKVPQIYTVIVSIGMGRLRDLQYIFALIYGTPSKLMYCLGRLHYGWMNAARVCARPRSWKDGGPDAQHSSPELNKIY